VIGSHAPFLTDVPFEVAVERFSRTVGEAIAGYDAVETVPLDDALDRVSERSVFARLSSPHYHACAMDGIAVRSHETHGATETAPRALALGSTAQLVDTGDPLPSGYDAVIPIESVRIDEAGTVSVRAAVAPFAHVRAIGEDLVATEAVVTARRRLGAADLAALAAAGVTEIAVIRRPRIAIVTTGDELVDPSVDRPRSGQILDSNSVLLAAIVRRAGGEPRTTLRIPDDPDAITIAVTAALPSCDVVVINAGSSAGRDDYTAQVFAAIGTVLVHGVAIRPGHPLVLGVSRDAQDRTIPLLGIPGYPVSAAICAELFLEPLVERLGGREPRDEQRFDVTLARKLYSPLGEDEFVRIVAARIDDRIVGVPLRRGAGVITSLSRANAMVTIPRFSEGARAGTTLRARALRPAATIERTILAVGSHDVAIDLLAGDLARHGIELVAANVGSIAGLVAVGARSAHLAGTHVLDAQTGSYNDAAVRRYLPSQRIALVHFAQRQQGLIVARGNPLGLRTAGDIVRTRARYVNRQRDAGTRMLFDAVLAREAIDPVSIDGYDRIEFTHLAVAALIADGSADCGLGILAAARALECDFVPIASEPYELAMPASSLEDPRIVTLLEAIAAPALRSAIDALGGYDASRSGAIRTIEPAA